MINTIIGINTHNILYLFENHGKILYIDCRYLRFLKFMQRRKEEFPCLMDNRMGRLIFQVR